MMRTATNLLPGDGAHLSDEDVLLYIDGEMAAAPRLLVQKHLEACWECRARCAEMESAITNFIQFRRAQFQDALPPIDGPRALLRAQLAQLSASLPNRWKNLPFFHLAPSIATAALAILVMAILPLLVHHGWQAIAPTSFLLGSPLQDVVPRRSLTPGEIVSATIPDVCAADFPTETSIEVPASLTQRVFARYGITYPSPQDFQVDFLITPDLGGAMTTRNLWPEPYGSTRWNAHVKDRLEYKLKTMVCSGNLDLATAQHDLATNWIAAYKKYLGNTGSLAAPRPMSLLVASLEVRPSRY